VRRFQLAGGAVYGLSKPREGDEMRTGPDGTVYRAGASEPIPARGQKWG
jgi:hypothetical protein